MLAETYPLRALLLTVSGLMHRHQTRVLADLVEENRTLKEQRGGRPGPMKKIKALIVQMATDNSGWGSTRILGEPKGAPWRRVALGRYLPRAPTDPDMRD